MSWFFSTVKELFSTDKKELVLKEDIKKILYQADISTALVDKLLHTIKRTDGFEETKKNIEKELLDYLMPFEAELKLDEDLNVVMLVGVNGVGKTTTAAKLAKLIQDKYKKKVMLAGADTFRAAGVDQLEQWSKKIGCDFFSKGSGSDPGAVAYESVTLAKKNKVDVLLIDTGGRLHTQVGLMSEISKTQKAISKSLGKEPKHVLLIVDSTQGQNIKNQVDVFSNSLNLSGLILTKFDGTAKGGALLGAIESVKKPVFFISNGEKLENISEFKSSDMVHKIL